MLPLLLILVGTLLYGLVLVSQQAVAFAAQRGADAVVQVDPAAGNFEALAASRAETRVNEVLAFLPGDASVAVVSEAAMAGPPGARDVTVTVSYSFANWGLPRPAFLPLPDTLRGVGFVRAS